MVWTEAWWETLYDFESSFRVGNTNLTAGLGAVFNKVTGATVQIPSKNTPHFKALT